MGKTFIGLADTPRTTSKGILQELSSTYDDYAWIRVSVYSGLRGNNLVSRYIDVVIERVIHVISLELQHEGGFQ